MRLKFYVIVGLSVVAFLSALFTILIVFRDTDSEQKDGKLRGSGTKDDPYLIEKPDDFTRIFDRDFAYYKLINNIDLSNLNLERFGKFNGELDGNGKTISCLKLDFRTSYKASLIGEISEGSVIKNTNFELEVVPGTVSSALAQMNKGEISNCSFLVKVSMKHKPTQSVGANEPLILPYRRIGITTLLPDTDYNTKFLYERNGVIAVFGGLFLQNSGTIKNTTVNISWDKSFDSNLWVVAAGVTLHNMPGGEIESAKITIGLDSKEVEHFLLFGVAMYNLGNVSKTFVKGDIITSSYSSVLGLTLVNDGKIEEICCEVSFTGGNFSCIFGNFGRAEKIQLSGSVSNHTLDAVTSGLTIWNYGSVSECCVTCDIKGMYASPFFLKNYGMVSNSLYTGRLEGLICAAFGHDVAPNSTVNRSVSKVINFGEFWTYREFRAFYKIISLEKSSNKVSSETYIETLEGLEINRVFLVVPNDRNSYVDRLDDVSRSLVLYESEIGKLENYLDFDYIWYFDRNSGELGLIWTLELGNTN
ncbi:hypothetical protein [Fervidobacterium thailandense]|uniref:GLUG domain-containing protein n=1 Tax=Fervidobacterium thailandense TaxID=1008305 RepID=A0A1E3G5A5_9BACT|nr:hypothetical protein [Fervidobacterium thailandense]ODN31322.1 hypothetical protein A4H02_00705 [Fervidobacterium thailandense]